MEQRSLPTGWIKIWVGIGAVVFLCLSILPSYLGYRASKEVVRYRECLNNQRRDCERSIVWNLVDIAQQIESGQTGRIVSLDAFRVNDVGGLTPPSRSSEKAPLITKVEPKGMSNANGTYRILAGSEVTLAVEVEGATTKIEAFLPTADEKTPKPVVTLKKIEGSRWEGKFRFPAAFTGEMEVRATGADAKDRSSLYLLVAAN